MNTRIDRVHFRTTSLGVGLRNARMVRWVYNYIVLDSCSLHSDSLLLRLQQLIWLIYFLYLCCMIMWLSRRFQYSVPMLCLHPATIAELMCHYYNNQVFASLAVEPSFNSNNGLHSLWYQWHKRETKELVANRIYWCQEC